jgi:hypothetical protein
MNKTKLLNAYFWIFGLLNIFVISFTVPLMFGDQFLWHPRNLPTEMMLSVMYFAMGVIMIFCAKNPTTHKSFLDFVVLANCFHAIVMAIYAEHIFHILIDTVSIGLMGILPLFIYPWGIKNFLKYSPFDE